MNSNCKKQLKGLICRWKQRKQEYDSATPYGNRPRLEANRYEGIAIGTRWCIEDLEKLFK